jgi:hypothetical protein
MRWLPVSFALGVALSGCGDDAEPPHIVRKSIGPDGGLITSHDGVLTIALLEGALPETTTVEVFPSDEPPLVFGPAYRVRPNVPLAVEAEITYRRVLPEDPEDTAIAAIRLADYEADAGWWRPLPRINLDEEHDAVLALDSELSLYYALLEDANGPDPAESDDGMESSSDDESPTEDSGPSTEDDSSGPALVSHAEDIQPIWDARCLGPGCHEEPSPGNGLVLNVDAYTNLVDVFATGANRPLVDPGNPDNSFLVNKLDGSFDDPEVNGSGSRMPLAMDPLTPEELDLVVTWIEQGAMP